MLLWVQPMKIYQQHFMFPMTTKNKNSFTNGKILHTSMNAGDNFGANYYYDYVGNIDIYQLDEKDTRRLGVRVMEAFPKTIGSIEMGYANANQIEKMTVSFAYRYWEILPGGAGSSFLNRLANIAINQVERKLISKLPKVLTRL